jgi:hypothetical protein
MTDERSLAVLQGLGMKRSETLALEAAGIPRYPVCSGASSVAPVTRVGT